MTAEWREGLPRRRKVTTRGRIRRHTWPETRALPRGEWARLFRARALWANRRLRRALALELFATSGPVALSPYPMQDAAAWWRPLGP